jgi:hypothetical protein
VALITLALGLSIGWLYSNLVMRSSSNNELEGMLLSDIREHDGQSFLALVYNGQLNPETGELETLNASKVKVTFVKGDGSQEDVWLSGDMEPYHYRMVSLPSGAEAYVIYYQEGDRTYRISSLKTIARGEQQ